DATHGRASHKNRVSGSTSGSTMFASSSGFVAGRDAPLRQTNAAHAVQRMAKAINPLRHIPACSTRVQLGSIRKGYDSSASSEPKLESANSRYGDDPSVAF